MSLIPNAVAGGGILPNDYYFPLTTDPGLNQTLDLSGNTLSISNGNSVDIASATSVALSAQKLTAVTYDNGLLETNVDGVLNVGLGSAIGSTRVEGGKVIIQRDDADPEVEFVKGLTAKRVKFDGTKIQLPAVGISGEIYDSFGNPGSAGQQLQSSGPGLPVVWGAGSGVGLTAVVAGSNISVDNTNPIAPVVNLSTSVSIPGSYFSGDSNITVKIGTDTSNGIGYVGFLSSSIGVAGINYVEATSTISIFENQSGTVSLGAYDGLNPKSVLELKGVQTNLDTSTINIQATGNTEIHARGGLLSLSASLDGLPGGTAVVNSQFVTVGNSTNGRLLLDGAIGTAKLYGGNDKVLLGGLSGMVLSTPTIMTLNALDCSINTSSITCSNAPLVINSTITESNQLIPKSYLDNLINLALPAIAGYAPSTISNLNKNIAKAAATLSLSSTGNGNVYFMYPFVDTTISKIITQTNITGLASTTTTSLGMSIIEYPNLSSTQGTCVATTGNLATTNAWKLSTFRNVFTLSTPVTSYTLKAGYKYGIATANDSPTAVQLMGINVSNGASVFARGTLPYELQSGDTYAGGGIPDVSSIVSNNNIGFSFIPNIILEP